MIETKFIYYIQKNGMYSRIIKYTVTLAQYDKLLNEPESDYCRDFESAKSNLLHLFEMDIAGFTITKIKLEASKEEDLTIIPLVADDIFDKKS